MKDVKHGAVLRATEDGVHVWTGWAGDASLELYLDLSGVPWSGQALGRGCTGCKSIDKACLVKGRAMWDLVGSG